MIYPKISSLRDSSLGNERFLIRDTSSIVVLFKNKTRNFSGIDGKHKNGESAKFRLRGGGIHHDFFVRNTQPIPPEYPPPAPLLYFPPQPQYPTNIPCNCQPTIMYNVPVPCTSPPVFFTLPQTPTPRGIPTPSVIPQLGQQIPETQLVVAQSSGRSRPPFERTNTFFESEAISPFFESKLKPVRRFTLPAMKFGEEINHQKFDGMSSRQATPNISFQVDVSPKTGTSRYEHNLDEVSCAIRESGHEACKEPYVRGLTNQEKVVLDALLTFVQHKKNIVQHLLSAKALKARLDSESEIENRREILQSYHQHKIDALEQMRLCTREKDQMMNLIGNMRNKEILKSQISLQEDFAIEIQLSSQGGDASSCFLSHFPGSSSKTQSVVFPSVNQLLAESDGVNSLVKTSRCSPNSTRGVYTTCRNNTTSNEICSYTVSESVDNSSLSDELILRQKDDEEKKEILGMLRYYFQQRRNKLGNLLKLK